MNASITLAVLVTLIFALLGTAKILALPPMRALAAEAGSPSTPTAASASLEVAGAVGVALGLAVPLLGRVAAAGLLLLLAGALVTHLRATTTGRASTRPPSSAACSSPATSPR